MTSPSLRAALTALGIAALVGHAVAYALHTPSPRDASAPPTEFSAARAMRHVAAIAQRPHPAGSADHARVHDYVVSEIASLGFTPTLQNATGVGTRYATSGRVRNVLARVKGTANDTRAVLLMAHYDGVPAAPAAADDGSGTAALLETLRALKAGAPLAHDIIVLFTDAEEAGLVGAAAFTRDHPWAKDVDVVLNFEARGVRGPSLMFETGPGNLDIVRVLRAVHGVKATSLSTTVYRQLPNDTDLSELALLERPALNFAFIGGVDHYHTALDDTAHLSSASVQHHGDEALTLARALANGPLPRPVTGDAVFFDFPFLGLVVYPESWALPLAIAALALILAAFFSPSAATPDRVRGALLGAGGTIGSLILSAAAAYAVATLLGAIHRSLSGGGTPQLSGDYALGIALLTVAICSAVFVGLARRASPRALFLGALLFSSVISLCVAWVAPGVSFLFTWPLLAVAVVVLLEAFGGRIVPGVARPVIVWIATAVVVTIIASSVYLMVCVALGLDATGAILLSVFTALAAWLLVPHLERISCDRYRCSAIIAGVAALMFLDGLATVRTDADHPAGSSLVYAVDADSGTAWLAGSSSGRYARRWVGQTLRAMKQGEARPPLWLAQRYGQTPVSVAGAPNALGAPVASVVSDASVNGARTVTLRIVPPRGALGITMDADSGMVAAAAVDGVPVVTTRYRARARRWRLDYAAPSDSGFTLRLTLAPSARPVIGLLARASGLPFVAPARPVGVVPIQNGDVSIAYRRVRL